MQDIDRCIPGHTAHFFDRGGTRRIGPALDLYSVKWNRVRDAVSESTISIAGTNCDNSRDFLEGLRAHRHEMVIFRGEDRVWEGPINRIADYGTRFEINAHDVMEYLLHQPLTQKWSSAYPNNEPVTTRIERIIRWEMTHGRTQTAVGGRQVAIPAWESLNPPANVVPHVRVHHFPNEAGTSTVTYPGEMTVGAHLQGLARQSGIDFTVIGRALHIWDVSRSLGQTAPMTDENFLANVILTEYGSDHAQAAYVTGNSGVYGEAANPDGLDYYGPWTKVFTNYNEEGTQAPTVAELNSQAQRNLTGRSPVPIEVRIPDNSTILLTEALSIDHLVPGTRIPLRAVLTTRKMDQMQKIDSVTITETPERGENIQVTLMPASREDADEEE